MTVRLELGRTLAGEPLTLKAARLRTHGVLVGMTGSGKTGLGLVLLEELVAAGVPIIAIDPKGDIGNLGLIFPQFRAEDFAPWCGRQDPAEVAHQWQSGLLSAGIPSSRVRAVRERLALTVYTPGSTAGVPIDLFGMLESPPSGQLADEEARQAVVTAAVSGLLGLAGRKVDPFKDPAHVTLCHLVDRAWRNDEQLDLATLLLQLVDPPFERVGVFPVDRFFPPDDRVDLAMAFNAILAAPSFRTWRQGEGLDPERLLAPGDRTPVSVFNIAHLDDRQRQFFVSLLLGRLLAWTRRQPGTEDLRAILFFDEVAGYLPPYPRNPPSKDPLLTLMKQARAVGFGVVVSTQNPVDLDYKALSNAGTWCIGRLTTEQDRARLLKGIDGTELDGTVAGLEKRQFLLHEIGRGSPAVFGSRHAMSYLRGPLTAVEVADLNALYGVEKRPGSNAPDRAATRLGDTSPAGRPGDDDTDDRTVRVTPTVEGLEAAYLDARVAFSARMQGAFSTSAAPARADGSTIYKPALVARLRLRFDEHRSGFVHDEELVRVWFPLDDGLPETHLSVRLEAEDLVSAPEGDARYVPVPPWIDESKEVKKLQKTVIGDVYRTETSGQFINRPLKLYGKAGESRSHFDQRCRQAIEARIDEAAAKLKDRFETTAARLDDRLAQKRAQLVELKGIAQSRQLEEAVNLGATILSFFGGRKKSVTTAVSKRRQSSRAAQRVDRLEDEIARLENDALELEADLQDQLDRIRQREEADLAATEERTVRLEKSDIEVAAFMLLWVPQNRRV